MSRTSQELIKFSSRRPRAARHRRAALLGIAALLASGGARAATHQATLSGDALGLEDLCARKVTVAVDPSLHGSIAVEASADNPGEIDRLRFESGSKARIRPPAPDTRCWSRDGEQPGDPTLTLSIRVPVSFPLSVSDSGSAQYRIGRIGALQVDVSGALDLAADAVAGKSAIDISGQGKIAIGTLDADSVSIDSSGQADVTIAGGRIGTLDIDASGSGTLSFGAPVRDAQIDGSGSARIALASVTGGVTKDLSGSSAVTIGGH